MSIVTPLLLIISLVVSRALFSYMTSVLYLFGFMSRFVLMSDAIVGAAGDVLGAVTGVIRHVPTLFLEYVFFFRFALLVYVEAIKRLLEQLWASRISWQDLIAGCVHSWPANRQRPSYSFLLSLKPDIVSFITRYIT